MCPALCRQASGRVPTPTARRRPRAESGAYSSTRETYALASNRLLAPILR
jgi:hypothetical protein